MERDVVEGDDLAASPAEQRASTIGDFSECYREHRLWAARLAFILTGDVGLAEELRQDAFIGLYRHFDTVANPRAYLRASLAHLATRHRGQERRRADLHRLVADREAVSDSAHELFDVVRSLPTRQRAVIVLRYYEDMSEAEIASVLRCRTGTVKSLASRALDRLRKELADDR